MTLGSMDHGEGSAAQLIQLEPLIHQVSGHSSLWVLDDVTVCKPLIGREAKFYRTLPPQMRAFTPEFRGTVKVLVQRTPEGVAVAALPASAGDLRSAPNNPTQMNQNKSVKVRRVSIDTEAKEKDDACPAPPTQHNPWLQQCQQRYLNKLQQRVEATTNIMECILLENLTHVYRVPNVLDLKMGTRQYGDDAPESKRRSQTRKAQYTTTPRLGVRLAGMQVFNRDTKCYVCKNKYVGRELSEDGFQQTLRHFLHNGRRFRADIVDQIICKLTDLRKVVATLDSFRFFTSSLLILYDSYDAKGSTKAKDTSAGRDKDKHTDQENRNKNRERSERRSDPSEPSTEADVLHAANSKAALANDVGSRDAQKAPAACIAKRRDFMCSGGSNIANDNSECANCNSTECLTCAEHAHVLLNSQTPKMQRSGKSNVTGVSDCSSINDLSSLDVNSTQRQQLHLPQDYPPVPSQPTPNTQNTSGNSHKTDLLLNRNLSACTDTGLSNGACSGTTTTTSDGGGGSSSGGSGSRSSSSSGAIADVSGSSSSSSSSHRTKVDIRLIDFAHATHRGMGDATIYSGPDDGMMLGLKSLINIFTNIKDVYTK